MYPPTGFEFYLTAVSPECYPSKVNCFAYSKSRFFFFKSLVYSTKSGNWKHFKQINFINIRILNEKKKWRFNSKNVGVL